ncbi:cation transporting ATPase C-terminal domain-containing protein, partial [Clostridioides difficile]|uniref:cation transporting ATPase C-terminal domain-containing protein n=1 Tax=Clostridioides difficile TaxID=1496 RepID=UPI003F8D747E
TGKDMPFTTIQLLWVNIIMDGPPALALGLEPVRDYVLKRKPIVYHWICFLKLLIQLYFLIIFLSISFLFF